MHVIYHPCKFKSIFFIVQLEFLGSRYVYSPIYGNYILAFALSMKIYAHEIIKKERKLKVAVT